MKTQETQTITLEGDPIALQVAAVSNGNRVTPADIRAAIRSEHYFTAADGERAANATYNNLGDPGPPALALLTFCVLVLQNGFTVTGQSACADPANFDAEIGRQIARQEAEQKVWPLLGYALRQQLHELQSNAI